jgi:fructose-specific component phosphotransferase system IIB-like protein
MRKSLIGVAAAFLAVGMLTSAAAAEPSGNAVQQNGTREIVVAGVNGVPADAKAVMLNVTAVDSANAGFATVYPCGETLPTASNLNMGAGQTVPNAVVVRIGAGGKVCVFSSSTVDAIVDVSGYFPADTSAVFLPNPTRVMDTRGGPRVAANAVKELALVPPVGTTAAILNVTATDPQGGGFVTVFPCGQPTPEASNLNFLTGQTTPNLVMAKPGVDNKVCFYSSADVHLIADVSGWMTSGFIPSPVPVRVLSTRDGVGAGKAKMPKNGQVSFTLPSAPAGASAAVLNVTVTNPKDAGFVTVFPCGQPTPSASNLNFSAGKTIPNLVLVRPGLSNTVCFTGSSDTDLLADLSGWVTTGYVPLAAPTRADDTRSCGYMIYQENETPPGSTTIEFITKYYAVSSTGGNPVKILDETDYLPGSQTSLAYGYPLVGADCFVYLTEETYTHPDATTFKTVSFALLRVNPQTGQRTKVIDLTQNGFFYLVGQDPVTREIYLAQTIDSNQTVLYSVAAGATALANRGAFQGVDLTGARDMQHIYYQRFDATNVTRQLVEATKGGGDRVIVGAGLPTGRLYRSPDGSKLLLGSRTTYSVIDINIGTVTDVTGLQPLGWSPDSYLATLSPDFKTVFVTRNGQAPSVLLTAPPSSVGGIFSLSTGP